MENNLMGIKLMKKTMNSLKKQFLKMISMLLAFIVFSSTIIKPACVCIYYYTTLK